MLYVINETRIKLSDAAESMSAGGTSSYLAGFINYLLKKQLDFRLVGNFEIESKPKRNIFFSYSKNNLSFLWYLGRFFFAQKFQQKDIFYFQRPDHDAMAGLVKGKHVVHLHGQPHTTINADRNWFKRFIYNLLEHYSMPKAGLVIATDSITAKLYTTLYPSITSRLIIIPTGVNLVEYNININSVSFPGMHPSSSNLVYIGRLAYPKQVSVIIATFANAFGNDSATHLWIAGTGPDEHQLRYQASQTSCSANIHFTGILTRESVKSLIHSSDAGILLSHNEGSPITVKEFLACGKPVIVNNVGDISTYVTDGVNGFIVDPQQPGSVENAMTNIFHHAKEMSASCRASMLPYDEEKIFEQVHKALLALEQN